MSKKEVKKSFVPRTETDTVWITPATFVLEVQGTMSNNYQFTKQLGQGSYGTVYEAIHKKTKEKRAIKLIDKSYATKQDEKELFGEIKVLKELVAIVINNK